MDRDHARELLTDSLESLEINQDFADRLTADTASDPEHEGEVAHHPGDEGTDTAEAEGAQAMERTVYEERRRITDALARLDDGSYGRCLVCGREIDDERLEARPEAATCREHADTPVVT